MIKIRAIVYADIKSNLPIPATVIKIPELLSDSLLGVQFQDGIAKGIRAVAECPAPEDRCYSSITRTFPSQDGRKECQSRLSQLIK